MAKVAVLMADGFEEVEALGVVDILRRAEVDVDTVSIKEEQVVISSRNIPVRADKTLTDMDYYDMIVIPGGAGAWTLRVLFHSLRNMIMKKDILQLYVQDL